MADRSELDGFNLAVLGRERRYGGPSSPLSDPKTLKLAKDLLRAGVLIQNIAERCGYASRAAFVHAFIRLVGQPPSDWRSDNRGPITPDVDE